MKLDGQQQPPQMNFDIELNDIVKYYTDKFIW